MSVKQDRQGARTPTDLERKYNFDTRFADIMGAATDARTAAEKAQNAAEEAQNNSNNPAANLTHEEVFNLLTNNGTVPGIYRGDDGEIYINASYLKSGIIDAAIVKVINLIAEKIRSTSQSSDFEETVVVDDGNIRFTEKIDDKDVHVGSIFSLNEILEVYSPKMLRLVGDVRTQVGNIGAPTGIYGYPLLLVADDITIGNEYGNISLKGKHVSWLDNGDGTFTLIGT